MDATWGGDIYGEELLPACENQLVCGEMGKQTTGDMTTSEEGQYRNTFFLVIGIF